jgi:hypothetical protein
MSLFRSALEAAGTIEPANFIIQGLNQTLTGGTIGIQVEVLYFLLYDPVGHRVDIVADNITTKTIGFKQWRATPHEGIGYAEPLEVVGTVKGFFQGSFYEFGEQQAAEEGSRPAGKPFVNGNDGPVVLLDLFLPQGQIGYEGYIKIALNHWASSSNLYTSEPAFKLSS